MTTPSDMMTENSKKLLSWQPPELARSHEASNGASAIIRINDYTQTGRSGSTENIYANLATHQRTEEWFGNIILIDMPVKEFGEVGQFAQVLWKFALQRSIERRNVSQSPRPCFLFADEAQHFVTSYDMQFQTTCRAARVATVLLSQNVSNFYAALGGSEKGKAEATSLFANLNTKVFHAQADPVTNEWAASLVGRTRQLFANGNNSYTPDDYLSSMMGLSPAGNTSAGFSEQMEFELQPNVFTRLRTGGSAYKGLIDAIVFQNGRRFQKTGRTWLPVTFQQKF